MVLSISMEVVTVAEDTVDSVVQVSAPLVNEIADEIDATIAEPIKETEIAQKAQVSLSIAKKQVPFCLCVFASWSRESIHRRCFVRRSFRVVLHRSAPNRWSVDHLPPRPRRWLL